jgi:hypothetical protein
MKHRVTILLISALFIALTPTVFAQSCAPAGLLLGSGEKDNITRQMN